LERPIAERIATCRRAFEIRSGPFEIRARLQLVAVRRRERLRVTCDSLFVPLANLVLESCPLRLLRIAIFLTRVAMFSAWAPGLVTSPIGPAARSITLGASCGAFRPWPLPSPLALTEPGLLRGFA
jgi:hypothetical protein